MIYYEDKRYKFFELFNESNGTLVRSNILGTQLEADRRSFPELIDIGIMGKCEASKYQICSNAGIECYQNAKDSQKENMSLDNYENILKQSQNKVFQIALGGAGDPNKHEYFEQILEMTRFYGIVPNMTTSGYNISDSEVNSIKRYCGAVAVSFYSRLNQFGKESNIITIETIKRFVDIGCITNIHYVVSDETIDEAIYRLKHDLWIQGINAIIFILYKPVGLGKREKVLKNDARLSHFLDLAIKNKHPYRVGFDTCFTSALIKYVDFFDIASIDACEAAKFSMYIDSEMNAYPCSFDNQKKEYKVSLRDKKIIDAWNSDEFEKFRSIKMDNCSSCEQYVFCNGGCKLKLGIELCM